MAIQTITADRIISIRDDIAECPYCNAALYVTDIDQFVEDEHGWKADSITTTCGSEPDMDDPEWDSWLEQHSYMPYVYQLPVDLKIMNWLNQHYRFAI